MPTYVISCASPTPKILLGESIHLIKVNIPHNGDDYIGRLVIPIVKSCNVFTRQVFNIRFISYCWPEADVKTNQ